MSDSVDKADLAKALDALKDIAKGHSSRGTPATQVESMRDGSKGAGSSAGATQVHHTASNSDVGSWAGSSWSGVPEDGATDSVGADGTDYSPQGKMMKSIMEKLAKGIPLTADEFQIVAKGGLPPFMKDKKKKGDDEDEDKAEKAMDYGDDDDDAEDKKKAKKKDMEKSLSDYASEDEAVSKGLEVSEFLAGFTNIFAKSLESMEARIVSRLLKAQSSESEASGEFQKSLAEAVVHLGEAITATAQRVDQVESQPAHGARSAQHVQVLEKGGFGEPQDQPLSKSLVADTLVDLVQKGSVSVSDVLNYDSTGFLSPQTEAKVRAAVGNGR